MQDTAANNKSLHQVTCGEFVTENEAYTLFDQHMDRNPFFVNEREVTGRRLFDDKPVPVGGGGQVLRVDRIIHPTEDAMQEGWIWGPIGVEIKKSNMAVGPVLAQVLEQRQSIFRSKVHQNARIIPLLFAIFPTQGISHDLHSLLETQSIMTCHYHRYKNAIRFGFPGKNVLSVYRDHIEVSNKWQPSTTKGHRGRQK